MAIKWLMKWQITYWDSTASPVDPEASETAAQNPVRWSASSSASRYLAKVTPSATICRTDSDNSKAWYRRLA